MSAFKDLNQVGLLKFKPTIKITEMEIDKSYLVLNLENVCGKFGDQTKVELEEFFVYLPKRMTLKKEDMDALRKKPTGLVFRGVKHIAKFEKETALVEFVEL